MSASNRLVLMGYVIILRFVIVYSWRVSALLAATSASVPLAANRADR